MEQGCMEASDQECGKGSEATGWRCGLLHSVKGPKGGVALAKDAHFISLLEIMVAIDGTHVFKQCFLGVEESTENHYCPLHNNWIELREQLLGILGKTTLAKFTTEVKESNFQLAF